MFDESRQALALTWHLILFDVLIQTGQGMTQVLIPLFLINVGISDSMTGMLFGLIRVAPAVTGFSVAATIARIGYENAMKRASLMATLCTLLLIVISLIFEITRPSKPSVSELELLDQPLLLDQSILADGFTPSVTPTSDHKHDYSPRTYIIAIAMAVGAMAYQAIVNNGHMVSRHALVSRIVPTALHGAAFSLIGGALRVGGTVGPLIVSLPLALSYSAGFTCLTIVCAVSCIAIYGILGEGGFAKPHPFANALSTVPYVKQVKTAMGGLAPTALRRKGRGGMGGAGKGNSAGGGLDARDVESGVPMSGPYADGHHHDDHHDDDHDDDDDDDGAVALLDVQGASDDPVHDDDLLRAHPCDGPPGGAVHDAHGNHVPIATTTSAEGDAPKGVASTAKGKTTSPPAKGDTPSSATTADVSFIGTVRIYWPVILSILVYIFFAVYPRMARSLVVTIMGTRAGLTPSTISLYLGLSSMVDMLLFPISAFLLSIGRRTTAFVAGMSTALSFFFLAFATTPTLLLIACLLVGASNATAAGIVLVVVADGSPQCQASRPQFFALMRWGILGEFASSFVSGWLAESGPGPSVAAALAGVMSLLSWLWYEFAVRNPEYLRSLAINPPSDYFDRK